jgi:hypothetical protein
MVFEENRMKSHRSLWPRCATLLVLALTLGGCVVYPARVGYAGDVVVAAPPAPIVEAYGVPPAPGYVWIGGYWNWVGGRHVWVGGHWEAPRPGHVWVAHTWVREGGGWRMAPGHWERR